MIVSTITILIETARMAEANAARIMMHGSLLALVGAYFGFSGGAAKKVTLSWVAYNLCRSQLL